MRYSGSVALLVIMSLCLVCVLPASAHVPKGKDKELETFLSVIKAWGTFLAKITGSYDSLGNIAIFSNIARMWHDVVTSGEFSARGFFEVIMKWLGVSIMMEREEGPQGSYSI